MDEKISYLLGIVLGLMVISEARVISRRALPKDEPSGSEKISFSLNPSDKDNKFGDSPGIWDQPTGDDDFGVYEYDAGVNDPRGQPPDYDYNKPISGGKVDNNKPGILKPEKFPSDAGKDESPIGKPKRTDDKDRKPSIPVDEDKSIDSDDNMSHGDKDVDEKEPEEYDDDKKKNVAIDEERNKNDEEDEDEKHAPEDDDKTNNEPEEEDKEEREPDDDNKDESELDKDFDEESNEQDKDDHEDDKRVGGEAGFFDGGFSMFDTPFFNLEQVRKYFSQLDRALQHVFRQTLDEALLLNGTYANTTEEEVDIDGKKYIVQKSVIKGADNHSSIYVESLSTKSKNDDIEKKKILKIKNITKT